MVHSFDNSTSIRTGGVSGRDPGLTLLLTLRCWSLCCRGVRDVAFGFTVEDGRFFSGDETGDDVLDVFGVFFFGDRIGMLTRSSAP